MLAVFVIALLSIHAAYRAWMHPTDALLLQSPIPLDELHFKRTDARPDESGVLSEMTTASYDGSTGILVEGDSIGALRSKSCTSQVLRIHHCHRTLHVTICSMNHLQDEDLGSCGRAIH